MNITKEEAGIWTSLLNGGVKLPQMRIWWDMKQQYPKDMEEFSKLLEEEEEKKQEVRDWGKSNFGRKFGRRRRIRRLKLLLPLPHLPQLIRRILQSLFCHRY